MIISVFPQSLQRRGTDFQRELMLRIENPVRETLIEKPERACRFFHITGSNTTITGEHYVLYRYHGGGA